MLASSGDKSRVAGAALLRPRPPQNRTGTFLFIRLKQVLVAVKPQGAVLALPVVRSGSGRRCG
jgi:hypothetical protein